MELEQIPKTDKQEEEETVEEKLARMEAESELKTPPEETIESIENIAKEIESIKPKKSTRELRKRGRAREEEDIWDCPNDEKVPRIGLRDGLRTRTKRLINASDNVDEIDRNELENDLGVESKVSGVFSFETLRLSELFYQVNPPISSVDESLNEIEKNKDKILDKILEKPPEPPPVKLVISKKKGSIFKSRALVTIDCFLY